MSTRPIAASHASVRRARGDGPEALDLAAAEGEVDRGSAGEGVDIDQHVDVHLGRLLPADEAHERRSATLRDVAANGRVGWVGGLELVELRQQCGGADRIEATVEVSDVAERAGDVEVVALEVVERILGVGHRVRAATPELHRGLEVIRPQRSGGVEDHVLVFGIELLAVAYAAGDDLRVRHRDVTRVEGLGRGLVLRDMAGRADQHHRIRLASSAHDGSATTPPRAHGPRPRHLFAVPLTRLLQEERLEAVPDLEHLDRARRSGPRPSNLTGRQLAHASSAALASAASFTG